MMNVGMWGKALAGVPRVTPSEWQGLDIVSRWLIATRSAVIIMTLTSAAFAGLLALRVRAFDAGLWALLALGLCLAHATNNLVNDLLDSWKGVDRDNYFRTQYGPQPVEEGLLSVKQMLTYIAVTGLAALAAGAYLVAVRGEMALLLLGAGAFFVVFYTYPLKYIGLGEPAVLLVWGPLMVGGGYFVITGVWSHQAAVASLAYALAPTAVLMGKHLDKLSADRDKRIRTLPVILGERTARITVMLLLIAQLGVVVYLVWTGYLGPIVLIALLAAPGLQRIWIIYRWPRPQTPPPEMPEGVWPLYYVAAAFWYTRRFGALLVLGLVLDVLLSRL